MAHDRVQYMEAEQQGVGDMVMLAFAIELDIVASCIFGTKSSEGGGRRLRRRSLWRKPG